MLPQNPQNPPLGLQRALVDFHTPEKGARNGASKATHGLRGTWALSNLQECPVWAGLFSGDTSCEPIMPHGSFGSLTLLTPGYAWLYIWSKGESL